MGRYSSPKLRELPTVSSTICSSFAPKAAFENFPATIIQSEQKENTCAGPDGDLALGLTLRSQTGTAVAPSSQADEQILAGR